MANSFIDELDFLQSTGANVTIFWATGTSDAEGAAQTTGVITEVGTDFVKVRGDLPTLDGTVFGSCSGGALTVLGTAILLKYVHAVVEGLATGRKAALPVACEELDPPTVKP